MKLNPLPGAKEYIDDHCKTTAPPIADVAAVLVIQMNQGVPNQTKLSAQGSFQVVPAVCLPAYCWKYNLLSPQALDMWGKFIAEDESWRNLSTFAFGDNPPEPAYQIVKSGDAWIPDYSVALMNKYGEYVPVDGLEAQHFTILPHLVIAMLTSDPLALGQVNAMSNWLVEWAKQKCSKSTNPRELGWVCEAAGQLIKANAAVGASDDRPWIVAKACIERMFDLHGFDPQTGVPYVTQNPTMLNDKSHGFCRDSVWMTSRETNACGILLDTAPWFGPSMPATWWAKVKGLHSHGLHCQRWAMENAEAFGALPGGAFDDYEPSQPMPPLAKVSDSSHEFVDASGWRAFTGEAGFDGVMVPFEQPAMLTAQQHAPQVWGSFFCSRVKAWWDRSPRMVFHPSKASSMSYHDSSVAVALSGLCGFKVS